MERPRSTETVSYGGLTLAGDFAAWGLGIATAASGGPDTETLGRSLAMMFAGPGMPLFGVDTVPALGLYMVVPVGHLGYGQYKSAALSALLRGMVPALWGAASALIEGSPRSDDNPSSRASLGMLCGAAAVLLYPTTVIADAAFLARAPKDDSTARTARTARTIRSALQPSFDIGPGRTSLGLIGTF